MNYEFSLIAGNCSQKAGNAILETAYLKIWGALPETLTLLMHLITVYFLHAQAWQATALTACDLAVATSFPDFIFRYKYHNFGKHRITYLAQVRKVKIKPGVQTIADHEHIKIRVKGIYSIHFYKGNVLVLAIEYLNEKLLFNILLEPVSHDNPANTYINRKIFI